MLGSGIVVIFTKQSSDDIDGAVKQYIDVLYLGKAPHSKTQADSPHVSGRVNNTY